jgi:hypothetical protein
VERKETFANLKLKIANLCFGGKAERQNAKQK